MKLAHTHSRLFLVLFTNPLFSSLYTDLLRISHVSLVFLLHHIYSGVSFDFTLSVHVQHLTRKYNLPFPISRSSILTSFLLWTAAEPSNFIHLLSYTFRVHFAIFVIPLSSFFHRTLTTRLRGFFSYQRHSISRVFPSSLFEPSTFERITRYS